MSVPRTVAFAALIMVSAAPAFAQDNFPYSPRQMLILASERSYAPALQKAKAAAATLHYLLDLRGLLPERNNSGLTLSRRECAENNWEYPSYEVRGRELKADVPYVSVEYSSEYPELAKGYYIVVAAMKAAGDKGLQQMLITAKKRYPDAYLKAVKIYIGCEH